MCAQRAPNPVKASRQTGPPIGLALCIDPRRDSPRPPQTRRHKVMCLEKLNGVGIFGDMAVETLFGTRFALVSMAELVVTLAIESNICYTMRKSLANE